MVDLPPGFRVVQKGGAPAIPAGFRVVQQEQPEQSAASADDRPWWATKGTLPGMVYDASNQGEQQPMATDPPAGAVPGSREYADWAAEQARAGKKLPMVGQHQFPKSSILDPLVQGVTMGWGDELRGTVQGGIAAMQGGNFDDTYKQIVDEARQSLEQERRTNPIGSFAAEIVGAIPTSLAAGGGLVGQGGNALPRGLVNLGVGAGQGAVYGAGTAGDSIEERLQGAQSGALVGVATGVAVPAVTAGARQLFANPTKAAVRAAPTAAEIKASGQAAYEAAKASGVQIKPQAGSLLAHDYRQMLQAEGLVLPSGKLQEGTGRIRRVLAQLNEYTKAPMTLDQFQRLREAVQEVAKSPKDTQRRIGAIMLDQLDSFVEGLPDSAFIGPGGEASAEALAGARQIWARFHRTKAIEVLMYDATMTPGGSYETRLRSAVGNMLKKHRKRSKGFSESEVSAMERFVEGGAVGDLMRHFASGGVPGSTIVGGLAAGPVGAAVGAATSLGSKFALNKSAKGAIDAIRAQVATPGGIQAGTSELEKFLSRIGVGGSQPALAEQRDAISEMLFGR